MSGSYNQATLIGHLGRDPEVRKLQDGREVCNLAVATSESWKDKQTGERKEKTEWHRVVIWNDGLVKVAKQYLKKGSKVFLQGKLETRKWTDQTGAERYTTEIVLQGYGGNLIMLDGKPQGQQSGAVSQGFQQKANQNHQSPAYELDDIDSIPF